MGVGGILQRIGDTEYWGRLVPEWNGESREFSGYYPLKYSQGMWQSLLSILAMQGNFEESTERNNF